MEAWVTRPERPKGVKDEVKQARRAKSRPEGPPARSRAPEGPLTSSGKIIVVGNCTEIPGRELEPTHEGETSQFRERDAFDALDQS